MPDESLFPGDADSPGSPDNGDHDNSTDTPPIPEPTEPSDNWIHKSLYKRVIQTLHLLPSRFESELNITGVLATDLHTFNNSLGATIENQVVESLNDLRSIWDPEQEYARYSFIRQAQRFPDVVLKSGVPGSDEEIILGIELKGWYVLAKEKEPSYRFKASPNVCAPQDLLAVYPWVLSEVLSGTPELYSPYVTGARTAAEIRNWYWEYKMRSAGITDRRIDLSEINTYYPVGRDPISDHPKKDAGGNFGRFARTGLMDDYMEDLFREQLSGIPLGAWQRFLKVFAENKTEEEKLRNLNTGIKAITKEYRPSETFSEETLHQVLEHIQQIVLLSREY